MMPPAYLEKRAQLVPNWNSIGMPVTTPIAKLMPKIVPTIANKIIGNMFQIYRDFEREVLGARSADVSRSLNPALQTFDQGFQDTGRARRIHAVSEFPGTERDVTDGFRIGSRYQAAHGASAAVRCSVPLPAPRPDTPGGFLRWLSLGRPQ